MPTPLAICLEDLDAAPPAPRYVRCVALVGRQPGLRVDGAGALLWRSAAEVACELWVSGDDRLILFRPDGGAPVMVRRGGRSLAVPTGKPVVLLDQDLFEVGGRRLRVHVHGATSRVAAPSPIRERGRGRLVRATAAALALGAAVGGCSGKVEVRQQPPAVSPVPTLPRDAAPGTPPQSRPDAGQADAALGPSDAGTTRAKVKTRPGARTPTKIEVRSRPPDMAPEK